MKRMSLLLAIAGCLWVSALVWADRACCGESASIESSSSPCRPGSPCAAASESRSETAAESEEVIPASACAAVGEACGSACSPCVTEQVQGCPVRTTYRLVRDCQPVCRTRTVSHCDPCNPCRVTQTSYTEYSNRTRYRWVAETRPVCQTVRVYSRSAPACCGDESISASASTRTTGNAQVATAVARK